MRKKPSQNVEAEVLVSSRRRCCICYGLHRDVAVKSGQVSHLDRDSSNSALDNLVFLCFDHHAQYDAKTTQAKNFTPSEVKAYRQELYSGIVTLLEAKPPRSSTRPSGGDEYEAHIAEEQRETILEILARQHVVRSTTALSARVGTTRGTAERRLFELERDGFVRVDRRAGTSSKAYSLVASIANRLIDTFVATLGEAVADQARNVRFGNGCEVDAIVTTLSGISYVVETGVALTRLDNRMVKARVRQISVAKQQLSMNSATGVVLIGISSATVMGTVDVKAIESPGMRVHFVDVA